MSPFACSDSGDIAAVTVTYTLQAAASTPEPQVGFAASRTEYESSAPVLAPSRISLKPSLSVTITAPAAGRATLRSRPSTTSPSYAGSPDLTSWLTAPLVPSMPLATTAPATSPATLTMSLPSPPTTRVATPGAVESTSTMSSPSRPSTSSTSTFAYLTESPAP